MHDNKGRDNAILELEKMKNNVLQVTIQNLNIQSHSTNLVLKRSKVNGKEI